MVDMSKRPSYIALPPRLSYGALSQTDSLPSTPSPHTPLPYAQPFTPEIAALHDQNGFQLDKLAFAGVKRSRDEDVSPERKSTWTEDEMAVIEGVLLHPYRPLRVSYPPGDLPPPEVVDELASQVVNYAHPPGTLPTDRANTETPTTARKWSRSWEATRKKIFEIALAESKFGHEMDRKSLKEPTSGGNRPGLRRMDSMDFLDEREDEDGDVGRTMRLSTSLQNSAKQEPIKLSRTLSDSGPAMIMVTPASPETAPKPRPGLRGRGVAPRPSLLQRGRSFTAEDLAAAPDSPEVKEPTTTPPRVLVPPSKPLSQIRAEPMSIRTSSPVSRSPIPRSQSSSSLIPEPSVKDKFMNHQPILLPTTSLELAPEMGSRRVEKKATTGWSDSDEEGTIKVRKVKKIRGGSKVTSLKMTELTSAPGSGDGLRSPFEEKAGMGF